MAAHILCMLALAEREEMQSLTSEQFAWSIGTNPVVVRRVIGLLQRAGLVEARRGVGGGARLARSPERITLRDVHEAVREEGDLLGGYAPGGPSTECRVAPHVARFLTGAFERAEAALAASLDTVTIQQMASEVRARVRKA